MSHENSSQLTHDSYWIRDAPMTQRFETLKGIHTREIAVLGGGITGMSTALELIERGYKVTVLEALVIGGGTTGGSTGHLDAHPESGPRRLLKDLGEEKARKATKYRLDAIDAIEERANNSCDFKRVSAFSYSQRAPDSSTLQEEFAAARTIGLDVTWREDVPLPFDATGYEISHMGRIDSMAYLNRLVERFIEKGGIILERSVASSPVDEHPKELKVGEGVIRFEQVVCAVHCNYTGALRIYLQTPAYQSYVMAVRVKNPGEDALFWDNSEPYYYTRRANSREDDLLLIGGCDHRTGVSSSRRAQEELLDWVSTRYKVDEIASEWSAELYEPVDGLPIIGKVPGKENVWIATGLSGVGLTWGTAAGRILADQIEGKTTDLEDDLSPSRFGLGGVFTMASEQISTTANLAERVLPSHKIDVSSIKPGEGMVGLVDGNFTAVCRDLEGTTHARNPICVHMGGVVHWNEVEQTWDCPFHGGRYAACGARLYSPPESGLVAPGEPPEE